jgi:hypothetical protein
MPAEPRSPAESVFPQEEENAAWMNPIPLRT